MTIVTTCGHLVDSIDSLFDLQLKGFSPSGEKCIIYGCYCAECAQKYIENGEVIENSREEYEWVSSPTKSLPPLASMATTFFNHSDGAVAEFSRQVYNDLTIQKTPVGVKVTINTASAFSVLFNDEIVVTGVGKVIFNSINDAVISLSGAKITWVRPIKSHIPNGPNLVNSNDVDHCAFFIQYCRDAAMALLQGYPTFDKQDGEYQMSVAVI